MTATTAFIEDAIKGGWKPREDWDSDWSVYNNVFHYGVIGGNLRQDKWIEAILLDPLAWQAVGKTRGWNNQICICNHCGVEVESQEITYEETHQECNQLLSWPLTWCYEWHLFIDHLADGKSIEEALSKTDVTID